ncbi:fatty acid desaturase family protein [Caballeronia glebae]|uniref:fatty acid desaturase family protein n=1 Tax=Caballeronia glebae TaxID=1777143 RepID=UPI0038BCFAC5
MSAAGHRHNTSASVLHSERPRFRSTHPDGFSSEIRVAARAYLDLDCDHRYGNAKTAVKALLLLTAAVLLYIYSMKASSPFAFVGLYVAMYIAAVLLSVNTMHDASHGALLHSRLANTIVMRLVSLPLGIDPTYWQVRHVRYHHPNANIEHHDLDTEANRFLRQTPYQPWYSQFRFQHLYWPLIAGLSMPYIAIVYDWTDRLGLTPLKTDRLLPGVRGWCVFLASKALHITTFVVAPLWVVGPKVGYGVVLGGYVLGVFTASSLLLMLLLGTHWADTQFFDVSDGEPLPHTRDEHAFLTCCDWTPPSRILQGLLGGLHLHLTHHLFPSYGHRHYAALADIVEEAARNHGLPYRRLSYGELFSAQQRFLKSMGQRPAVANARRDQ